MVVFYKYLSGITRRMATFDRFPHIAEKILNFIDVKDLQDLRSVCRSWKKIIENPVFWLKRLKNIGQPADITEKWQMILSKAKESEISHEKVSQALVTRYCSLSDEDDFLANHFWKDLPIITALKCGSLEIVELLTNKMDFNVDQELIHHTIDDYPNSDLPIFIAMRYGNSEIVNFILSKMKKPQKDIRSAYGESLLRIAIVSKSLNILKMLVDRNGDSRLLNSELDFAIKHNDVNCAEIMVPKTKRSKLLEISRRLLWSEGEKSKIFRIVEIELEIRKSSAESLQ